MKKIFDSLKYIKINDLFSPFIFIFSFPFSLIFRFINFVKKRKLWLICEDGYTARDNGYHFYKYIRTNHPDDYCFYVIDKKKNDYNKVKDLGNIIQFKSFKHWIFYLSSKYNISNHKNGNPNQPFFYILHVVLNLFNNRVFLQHGITKDDAKWLYYKNTKFKYFICGAKKEYEYIKEKFGYPKKNVIYTGFPRFDNLYNNKINNKQILIIPTWRNWLGRETNNLVKQNNFNETDFYINWNGLLNSTNFINFIENNNYHIYFYPHINMNKYLKYFSIKSKNITICNANEYDIQKLLKESEIMITDYSSVYMDFAYMNKKIIYFQFDYKEYREKQYQDGYFNYENDGFGPICYKISDVIKYLNNLKLVDNDEYSSRKNDFFELKDKNNCQRIYNILCGCGVDKNEKK